MTQLLHKATTKQGYRVTVMAGWDGPLGRYFLTLFWDQDLPFKDSLSKDLPSACDEEVLYSAEYEKEDWFSHDSRGTERIEKIAREYFGITPPEGFWEKVRESMEWSNQNRRETF